MEQGQLSANSMSRPEVMSYTFPYKLWMVTNMDNFEFIWWNAEGTTIVIDFNDLDEYLESKESIFEMKESLEFLAELVNFQFESQPVFLDVGHKFQLEYKHEKFQRYRQDLLDQIRPQRTLKTENTKQQDIDDVVAGRTDDGQTSSKTNDYRVHLKMLIQYNKLNRSIKNKPKERKVGGQIMRGRGSSQRRKMGPTEEPQFQVSPITGENVPPILLWKPKINPLYAGYYGDYSDKLIKKFFGKILPVYEDGSKTVVKAFEDNFNFKELSESIYQSSKTSQGSKAKSKSVKNRKDSKVTHKMKHIFDESNNYDPDTPVTESPGGSDFDNDMTQEIKCETPSEVGEPIMDADEQERQLELQTYVIEMEEFLTFKKEVAINVHIDKDYTPMEIDTEDQIRIPEAERDRIDTSNFAAFF